MKALSILLAATLFTGCATTARDKAFWNEIANGINQGTQNQQQVQQRQSRQKRYRYYQTNCDVYTEGAYCQTLSY